MTIDNHFGWVRIARLGLVQAALGAIVVRHGAAGGQWSPPCSLTTRWPRAAGKNTRRPRTTLETST